MFYLVTSSLEGGGVRRGVLQKGSSTTAPPLLLHGSLSPACVSGPPFGAVVFTYIIVPLADGMTTTGSHDVDGDDDDNMMMMWYRSGTTGMSSSLLLRANIRGALNGASVSIRNRGLSSVHSRNLWRGHASSSLPKGASTVSAQCAYASMECVYRLILAGCPGII